jgi:hypothetical protein
MKGDDTPFPAERRASIRLPLEPLFHGVVRSFVTATCRAWGLEEEVANDARIAVSEVMAFATTDPVSIEVWPGGRGDLVFGCAGFTQPPAGSETMGGQLLMTLASDLHWGTDEVSFRIVGDD